VGKVTLQFCIRDVRNSGTTPREIESEERRDRRERERERERERRHANREEN